MTGAEQHVTRMLDTVTDVNVRTKLTKSNRSISIINHHTLAQSVDRKIVNVLMPPYGRSTQSPRKM